MPAFRLTRNLERVERLRRQIDLEMRRATSGDLRLLRLKAILLRFESRIVEILQGRQSILVPIPVRVEHCRATMPRSGAH